MYSEEILRMGEMIFNYLSIRDNIKPVDLIIGFGHFDMKIPRECGKLFMDNYSGKILLTGGIGAGTADLKQPEGLEFKNELSKSFPCIKTKDVIIESKSTNTAENIRFSQEILRKNNSEFCFENGIKQVIAVATSYRQRRVCLTLKKILPNIIVLNSPPETDFKSEINLFKSKNQDLIELLVGEIDRIQQYPEKGFIEYEQIPQEIQRCYKLIKNSYDDLSHAKV